MAQHDPKNAFSNNFDYCMITQWINAGILQTSPTIFCNSEHHVRLCYGQTGVPPAQYISCYNTEGLIPEFTAHVVPYSPNPQPKPAKRKNQFKMDSGEIYSRYQFCFSNSPRKLFHEAN